MPLTLRLRILQGTSHNRQRVSVVASPFSDSELGSCRFGSLSLARTSAQYEQ